MWFNKVRMNPGLLFTIFIIVVVVLLGLGFVALPRSPGLFNRAPTATSSDLTTSGTDTTTNTTEVPASGNTAPAPAKSRAYPGLSTSGVLPAKNYQYLVVYTSKGFSPATLQIKAGETVRFVNNSTLSLRVAAADTSLNAPNRELDQVKSVGKGGTYDFTFNAKGVVIYQNLNDKSKTGSILVK